MRDFFGLSDIQGAIKSVNPCKKGNIAETVKEGSIYLNREEGFLFMTAG